MSMQRCRIRMLGGLAALTLAGCAGTATVPEQRPPATALGRLPAGVSLIGLGGGDLEGMMGTPALIRDEGTAEYWRYGVAGCQLDLFLFADRAMEQPRVVYVDVRPAVGAPPDAAADCGRLGAHLRMAPPALPPAPAVSAPL